MLKRDTHPSVSFGGDGDDARTARSYSPVNNVIAQHYPAMLVTAGLHDPRVAYWEPAKWVALLREKKTDDNVLLLKTDLEAGHFSASDRYKYLRELAFDYSFLLDQLGKLVERVDYDPEADGDGSRRE